LRISELLLLLLLASVIPLGGLTLDFDVRSLGLKVAKLSVTTSPEEGYVSVSVNSLITNAMFPALNNVYRSEFVGDYLPVRYQRKVRQKKLTDDIDVVYDRQNRRATARHTGELGSYSYAITAETRDFFSFMMLLSRSDAIQNQYTLDGNGCLWRVNVTKKGREELDLALGKVGATVYELEFVPQSEVKMRYTDMVTHNLFGRNSKVTLWISDNHNPVRAYVRKGLLSMVWELAGIRS
jgi:hypothetical protein